jgi:hypothetical protein
MLSCKHNRSLKVVVQGLVFMAHSLYMLSCSMSVALKGVLVWILD